MYAIRSYYASSSSPISLLSPETGTFWNASTTSIAFQKVPLSGEGTLIGEEESQEESQEEEEEEVDYASGIKANDPVRLYLKEMGSIPLLNREGEVVITSYSIHYTKLYEALHRGHDPALPVLDPLGQGHLPLAVQERNRAHLLEVETHRVVRLDPRGIVDLLLLFLGALLLLSYNFV